MMVPQFFETTLAYRTQLTSDVIEFGFQLPKGKSCDFQAGQFINIRVDDGGGKVFFRSYSIMNSPREKEILKSCVKIIPDGRCTQWLNSLEIGASVTMMGPIGMFTLNLDSKKDFLFVATGTGITPLHSMILDLLESGCDRKIHLLWGFRHEKDLFYQNFFEQLAEQYKQFSFTTTLSQPGESWTGEKGRVTDWIEAHGEDVQDTQVYICGIGAMVLDVKKLCILNGVSAEDVHFERYD